MKSFKKLRDFARQGSRSKEKHHHNPPQHHHPQQQQEGGDDSSYALPSEDAQVAKGMKDVRGMQKCYEGLVRVSSEVSKHADDLSTAVEKMASCFTMTFGILEDREIGKIYKLAGEVQFEISKALEIYGCLQFRFLLKLMKKLVAGLLGCHGCSQASHVTQTVTEPTESLLSEVQHVMETKKEYDEKRQAFDQHWIRNVRGRPRNGKADSQDNEQLEAAKEEFEGVSRFLGGQLLSVQQGLSRNLITQVARHHKAQMQLLTKGLTCLHGIEPHMKQAARELNIDRRLSSEDEDEDDLSNTEIIDDGDLSDSDEADRDRHQGRAQHDDMGSESSENGPNEQLDGSRIWSPSFEASGSDRQGASANEGFESPVQRWIIKGSKSAPTSPISVSEGVHDLQEVDRPSHRFYSAVPAPTRSPPIPSDRGRSSVFHSDTLPHDYHSSTSERSPTRSPRLHNVMPASSPRLHGRTTKMGVPMTMFPPFESNPKSWPMPLPPKTDPPPVLCFDAPSLSSTPRGFVTTSTVPSKKKRYSHSGPLISTAAPVSRPISEVPSSGPLWPHSSATYCSGHKSPRGHTYVSPRMSPIGTPTKMSPPRINELHKLPPPPLSANSSPVAASTSLIAHSAPLPRPEPPPALHASPLPPPPLGNVTRSPPLQGATGKSQKQPQVRYKGATIHQLTEVDEEATSSSSQSKQIAHSGHSGITQSTTTKHQRGIQTPSLQRSVSGVGGYVTPRNGVEPRTPGKTPSGSGDKKMRRVNTILHSSPSLSSAYSVSSPPNADSVDETEERALPGNDFEHGRRSLDAALPGSNRNSKWAKWRSFSAHDRDHFPLMSQTGIQNRESSQMYGRSPSPRHATINGI